MKFTYKATDKNDKITSGEIEAPDKSSAMGSLLHQHLHPIVLEPAGGNKKRGKGFSIGKKKVKSVEIVIFTRQLSTMISAGVPLARGLSTLQNDGSPYFRQILASVTKDIEGGISLGDAFGKFPNVFNDVFVNMIKAGEEGGILDEILKRLASQVEQDASIRKKIKSAMMYPTVIMVITVLAFFGIMIFIMPKIATILTDLGGPNAQLPPYTRVLLNLSHFMQHNVILLAIILGGIGFAFIRYIHTPKGRYNWHSLLLKIPVVKTIITKVAIARFSRIFASLMSAGVGVLEALRVTGGTMGNLVIEEELKTAAEAVKNGKQLSDMLAVSPHFPKIVSQMLQVGEETGQVDTVLIKVADFYEEEVSTLIDGLASVIEPVMIIVLGGGVGLIAASVMGPIASLSQNVGSN